MELREYLGTQIPESIALKRILSVLDNDWRAVCQDIDERAQLAWGSVFGRWLGLKTIQYYGSNVFSPENGWQHKAIKPSELSPLLWMEVFGVLLSELGHERVKDAEKLSPLTNCKFTILRDRIIEASRVRGFDWLSNIFAGEDGELLETEAVEGLEKADKRARKKLRELGFEYIETNLQQPVVTLVPHKAMETVQFHSLDSTVFYEIALERITQEKHKKLGDSRQGRPISGAVNEAGFFSGNYPLPAISKKQLADWALDSFSRNK